MTHDDVAEFAKGTGYGGDFRDIPEESKLHNTYREIGARKLKDTLDSLLKDKKTRDKIANSLLSMRKPYLVSVLLERARLSTPQRPVTEEIWKELKDVFPEELEEIERTTREITNLKEMKQAIERVKKATLSRTTSPDSKATA